MYILQSVIGIGLIALVNKQEGEFIIQVEFREEQPSESGKIND